MPPMPIEKAIEILEHASTFPPTPHNIDLKDAIKLGIEALKSIKEHRAEFGHIPCIKLSGETERSTHG